MLMAQRRCFLGAATKLEVACEPPCLGWVPSDPEGAQPQGRTMTVAETTLELLHDRMQRTMPLGSLVPVAVALRHADIVRGVGQPFSVTMRVRAQPSPEGACGRRCALHRDEDAPPLSCGYARGSGSNGWR